ncbi:Pycsar system effector family protein [Amycolatopsis sp. NBC_00438]|uniref:Pycsar system effector family protein n=1 Tax=Amycolatopsis sp. NBC_00438 TaxID=2903558 RepID=UPI002E248DC3
MPDDALDTPNPDQAWKALSITNEWIRHADSKTGVTLAFVGATATMLFKLLENQSKWTLPIIISATITTVAMILAVLFAITALFPRVRNREQRAKHPESTAGAEESINLLFFGDVHRNYRDDRPTYRDVLSLLTSDATRLTGQIADQIHANAHIASVKFQHANRAISCELLAMAAISGVAFIKVLGW